ncbi:MAG: hypothetical protein EOM44_15125 [Bacteroidia bacterium]|nr:hypothetical protein [Bacteroidia bacterium]
MIKVNFTPKTDIEEYLNNDFNLEIFEDLTENEDWQGTFEPLDFLNLLYEQFEIVNANKEKPLSVVKHLFGLKLEQTKLYCLLYYLKRHIYKHSGSEYEPKDKQLSICRGFIEKEYDKLEAELYPKTEPEPQPEKENKYDFQKVKQHIETLTTVKDKILYLTEIKTDFLQNKSGWDLDLGTPFDRKCELEIKKLNEVLKLEAHTTTPKAKPIFKLSDKKGAKTDLIRVLNALYELRLFNKTDGQIPTKQEFIETMGEYLGVDLSKYHSNLSQALQNQPLEVNLKVFEEMKEATQKAHYQTK